MQKSVYLDYNATTPTDSRVLEAMIPYFSEAFGNPASTLHFKGWESKKAIDTARERAAALIGCQPAEITFTSGATESNNWVLKGLVDQLLEEHPNEKIHVITSNIEHASVREPLLYLQKKGLIEVDFLPVDREGFIELAALEKARKPSTKLISLIWVHNEIGTIQNVKEIAEWALQHEIYFHTDATQAVGKMPVNLAEIPISFLSFSGHKIYGPKGVGAAFIRQHHPKILIKPLLHGGGQEKLGRSGTANVPGIVGLGKACEIAAQEMTTDWNRVAELSFGFWKRLSSEFPELILNGPIKQRSVYNLNITFPNVQAYNFLPKIQNLCVSGGSACSSGNLQANPILLALGHSADDMSVTLRLSLGRMTTLEDMEITLATLCNSLKSLNFRGVPSDSAL